MSKVTARKSSGGVTVSVQVRDMAAAKRIARKIGVVSNPRRINVGGFVDSSGFHPIRSSADYDNSVDYDDYSPKKKAKKKAKKKK